MAFCKRCGGAIGTDGIFSLYVEEEYGTIVLL